MITFKFRETLEKKKGKMSSQPLCLNAFREGLASFRFEWHVTPNHNSFIDSSRSIDSNLHLVSPKLHLGHGNYVFFGICVLPG